MINTAHTKAEKEKATYYDEFVEKFKPKLTTDDCITPPEIYDTIADYVAERYKLNRETFVRPFWPGADYTKTEYPLGCCVVDNPPFSIISKIVCDLCAMGVRFFLFAPHLTICGIGRNACMPVTYLATKCDIVYENGAIVPTGFVTNMEPDIIMRNDIELSGRVDAAVKKIRRSNVNVLPKYIYPDYIITSRDLEKYTNQGIYFEIRREEGVVISALDSQKKMGKAIFGRGVLVSERKAAEKAAAEKAAAEKAAAEKAAAEKAAAEKADAIRWTISERERKIIDGLK